MMRRILLCATWAALDAKLALMDGRGGSRGKCEPQYIPIGGGGGSGLSEAEIKLLVQNEVASLRDDLVGRMQTAASMATQPLEQALSETQAECRTLERLDDAVDLLKRAPGIEEVDQRLAFSDAKLAAALARLRELNAVDQRLYDEAKVLFDARFASMLAATATSQRFRKRGGRYVLS